MTSGFLQIPPHDEHPCLRLTLPTAERVVVFHHLVVAHAGRTKMQSEDAGFSASSLSAHERYWVDTPARGQLTVPRGCSVRRRCGGKAAMRARSSRVCPLTSKRGAGAPLSALLLYTISLSIFDVFVSPACSPCFSRKILFWILSKN